jgi:hypothetical protein
MLLSMLDAYKQNKVWLNVKIFVLKVAKCKHSSILTSKQNTKSLFKTVFKKQKIIQINDQ